MAEVKEGFETMQSAAHSPLPWRSTELRCGMNRYTTVVDANGHQVVREDYAGDYSGRAWAEIEPDVAALIVRAVNAHEDLVAALKLARDCIAYCRKAHKDAQSGEGFPVEMIIDAALAKAISTEGK